MASLELTGHRGARGEVAENTLESFAHAYATGVHSVELDVGMTADGVLVVAHDRRLNPALTRGPDGRWLDGDGAMLFGSSYASLARYDVGRINPDSEYALSFPGQRAVDGARIPTLAAVLDLTFATAGTDIGLILEVKTSPEAPDETAAPQVIVDALVALVAEKDMVRSCIVESFDWRVMSHVQSIAPQFRTAYLTTQQRWLDNVRVGQRGGSAWTAGLDVDDFGGSVADLVHAAGGRIWAPYYREVDRQSVARAHELGQRVIVWTVNEPDDMRRLVELGVDGIITDYPRRLRALMQTRQLPLPDPK